MVKKTISSLTLEEGKEAFITTISNVLDIIQTIPEYDQHDSLNKSRKELESLLNTVQTKKELMETKQIDTVCSLFVQTVIYELDSQLSNQLESYWTMIVDLGKKAVNQPESKAGFHPMNIAIKSKEKLYHSDQLQRVADSAELNRNSESMMLHFYSHIVKTNAIEHCLQRELETSLVQFNLENSYDTKKIFSASNSVPKGSGSVTDAIALADALSYGKYNMTTDGESITVDILNDENGYRFQRSYSDSEFVKTTRRFSLLYRCQIMLLLFYAAYVVAKTILTK